MKNRLHQTLCFALHFMFCQTAPQIWRTKSFLYSIFYVLYFLPHSLSLMSPPLVPFSTAIPPHVPSFVANQTRPRVSPSTPSPPQHPPMPSAPSPTSLVMCCVEQPNGYFGWMDEIFWLAFEWREARLVFWLLVEEEDQSWWGSKLERLWWSCLRPSTNKNNNI